MTTYFIDDQAKQKAYDVARCSTAVYLLNGTYPWSLSNLKGKALHFKGKYIKTRENFLRRLEEAGLQPVTLYLRKHNKRVVII